MRIGAVRKLFGIKVSNVSKGDADDKGDCAEPNDSQPEDPHGTDPSDSQPEDPHGTDHSNAQPEDSHDTNGQVGSCEDQSNSNNCGTGDTIGSTPAEPDDHGGNNSQEKSNPEDPGSQSTDRKQDDISRSKHGPRGANEFPNAARIDCQVPGLEKGDECPADDCNGKLYPHQPDGSGRQLIVFDAQAPIAPTVYNLNDLQCNMCKTLFKAEVPKNMTKQGVERGAGRGYTFRCIAFLLVAHYYFGRSFRSLDQLTAMIGDRVADSTLNGKALEYRLFLARFWQALLAKAAHCPVIYGDDIGSKVISILPMIRKSRNGEYVCRNGIYTSIVIGITSDGKPIPILTTGLHHLGETLDRILVNRSAGLPDPVIVRDQSSSNQVTACKTISAGCLQHSRDNFVKARGNYPEECELILEKMSKIFEVDRKAHEMSPQERLAELRQSALPIMEDILLTVNQLIDAKEATPSSDMGIALSYFKKYYPSLMIPYEIPGIGLTNNLSEWMTYPVVRYLNNCRHYATEEGAEMGDYVVSLTMLALLSDRNPIKYLEYLLANQAAIKAGPVDTFLPWEISIDELPRLDKNWFTNWIPHPGQDEAMSAPEVSVG